MTLCIKVTILLMQLNTGSSGVAPMIPRPTPPTIVVGKPFHARFVSTSRRNGEGKNAATTSHSGEMFRNSRGDMRIEWFSESLVLLALIDKPGAFLHTASKAWMPLDGGPPRSHSVSTWAYARSAPVYTDSYKTMYGLRCRLVTLRDPLSKRSAGEAWIAEDAGIVVSDTQAEDGLTLEWKITELTFNEPDPRLFEIPADYTETSEP